MAEDVKVAAYLRAKPECKNAVEEALLRCVEPSRAKEGCLSYVVHSDIEDPLLFVVVEHWASLEIRNRHIQTEHFKQLRRDVDETDRLSEHYFNVLRPV